MRKALAGWTAVLMAASLPARAADDPLQPTGDTELIKTIDDRHNRMTVPVQIGTHGPFRFLIDTGSERTVLSRQIASLGIYPAVDPLDSTSRQLDPNVIGVEHYETARRVQATLQKYTEPKPSYASTMSSRSE